MRIGVPRELPIAGQVESRVALAPPEVAELGREGHEVWIERGAGEGAGFSDLAYQDAGARLVYRRAEVVGRAEILVSIGRLIPADLDVIEPGTPSLAFHQLAMAPAALRRRYAEADVVAIGMDRLKNPEGRYPVIGRLSELAGALGPQLAARLLESSSAGRPGILLGRLPGVPPAEVVILGAGVLGVSAARAFAGIGASVHLLDRDLDRLREAASTLPANVVTAIASREAVDRAIRFANVVVGAVRTPGELNPVLVSEAQVRTMRPGSVVLDFAIAEGCSFATSRPIPGPEAAYSVHGVVHFTMLNATTLVARTASRLLSQAILPYVSLLGTGVTPKAHRVFAPAIYFGEGMDES